MISKTDLRRTMRQKLQAQTAAQSEAASAEICIRLAKLQLESRTLSLFLAQPREPNIDAFASELQQHRVLVAAPHSRTKDAPFYSLASNLSNVRTNSLGWREPFEYSGGRAVKPAEVDTVLLPGLAFDAAGGRLGQGGGWYDRVLVNVPARVLRIGVCFEFQLAEAVPRESHDQAVSIIITEQRILYV